jgi:16S rRNA processing protein RimM
MGSDPDARELIIVGRVRKAHGIRGDLVVEPLTDEPDAVFAPGRRVFAGTASGDRAKDGRELHIATASPFKGGFIVHFTGIDDRNVAETWRERFLLAPADELTPLGENQVYIHELVGMRVELESGEPVGSVADTYQLPQGLTLDVKREAADSREAGSDAREAGSGKREAGRRDSVMIPYDRIVISVDREARVIRIAPPPGLLDD